MYINSLYMIYAYINIIMICSMLYSIVCDILYYKNWAADIVVKFHSSMIGLGYAMKNSARITPIVSDHFGLGTFELPKHRRTYWLINLIILTRQHGLMDSQAGLPWFAGRRAGGGLPGLWLRETPLLLLDKPHISCHDSMVPPLLIDGNASFSSSTLPRIFTKQVAA